MSTSSQRLKMGLWFLGLLIVPFIVAPLYAEDLFTTYSRSTGGLYTYKDTTLHYRFWKPVNYDTTQRYPLVLTLHSAVERGNDNMFQVMNLYPYNHIATAWADSNNQLTNPCFVVSPQCPLTREWTYGQEGMNWHGVPSIATNPITTELNIVIRIIDSLARVLPIDTNRIYVVGQSMGGFGTWNIIQRFPQKFAAGIPIDGVPDTSVARLLKLKNFPAIWSHHGLGDVVVPPFGDTNAFRKMENNGFNPVRNTVTYNTSDQTFDWAGAAISRDSLGKLVTAGRKYLFTGFVNANHGACWNTVTDDTIVHRWLFSQAKPGVTFDSAVINFVSTGGSTPATKVQNVTLRNTSIAMPTLAVAADSSWCKVAVSGGAIRDSIDIADAPAASGIYSSRVRVTVPFFAGDTLSYYYTVKLTISGTAAAASIVVTPSALDLAPSRSYQFSAQLLNQFGTSIAGTISWQVSGGGTISSTGLFTGNGTAGSYTVTATSGSVTKTATLRIADGKPLANGTVTQMLNLENTVYNPFPEYLMTAVAWIPTRDTTDTAGIEAIYMGDSLKPVPKDKDSILVSGDRLKWNVKNSADGYWWNQISGFSVNYGAVTIINQTARPVKLRTTAWSDISVWKNGTKLLKITGDNNLSAKFTLPVGRTNFLFKHTYAGGGTVVAIAFTDTNGVRLTDLRYDAGVAADSFYVVPTRTSRFAHNTSLAGLRVMSTSHEIRFSVVTGQRATLSLYDLRGARVCTFTTDKTESFSIPKSQLSGGMYVARMTSASTEVSRIVSVVK